MSGDSGGYRDDSNEMTTGRYGATATAILNRQRYMRIASTNQREKAGLITVEWLISEKIASGSIKRCENYEFKYTIE